MPSNTETDHLEEAKRLTGLAEGAAAISADQTYSARAQAHAQIAIAQELRGIREALEDVIDPTASVSFPGVLRVRMEAQDG